VFLCACEKGHAQGSFRALLSLVRRPAPEIPGSVLLLAWALLCGVGIFFATTAGMDGLGRLRKLRGYGKVAGDRGRGRTAFALAQSKYHQINSL